jgi:hypothetical protein
MTARPDLIRFSLLAKCSVLRDGFRRVGKTCWQLAYSLSVPSLLPGQLQDAVEDRAQPCAVFFPVQGEGALLLTTKGQHSRAACTLAIREDELYSADKWAHEERERVLHPEHFVEEKMYESDLNTEREWQRYRR